MLLAQALAKRKDTLAAITLLRDRLGAEGIRDQEEEQTHADAAQAAWQELFASLTAKIEAVRELTVAINHTNNTTMIEIDGRGLSVMEAIAHREEVALRHQTLSTVLSSMETALGLRKERYGIYGRRLSKDEVRFVPTVPLDSLRAIQEGLQEQLRNADAAIQRANWSTEVAD